MEPVEVTFSSGRTLKVRKVPSMLIRQLYLDWPAPKPPVQEVEVDKVKFYEENVSHPDYAAALEEHNQKMQERLQRLMVRRGVVHEMSDEEKQEVKLLQKEWTEDFGKPLPGNELEVYVYYICCVSDTDLNKLMEEVRAISQPTPKSDSGDNSAVESDVS